MYNQNQPRVPAGDASHHGGRWTDGSPQLASSAAPAVGMGRAGVFARALTPALHALLSRMASQALWPFRVLDALVIGIGELRAAEGVLPDHPDIGYRYNAATGFLTVTQDLPMGEKLVLFHGGADQDGLFRLPDGAVIGRGVDNGILLNEATARLEVERRAVHADAAANDNFKLCPDTVPDWPNTDKDTWQDYQQQITGLPKGWAILLNSVMFDGCRTTDGVMLEAKAEGYAWALKDGEFQPWYRGMNKLAHQMKKQSEAARGRWVEWHIAEKPVADYLRDHAMRMGYRNIDVRHTPPENKVAMP